MLQLDRILQRLRPGSQWSALHDDYESLVIENKPSLAEMQAEQTKIDAECAACDLVRGNLRAILASMSDGERVAYSDAIKAIGEKLDAGSIGAARGIVSTYPGLLREFREKILAAFDA